MYFCLVVDNCCLDVQAVLSGEDLMALMNLAAE